jgi:transcriptional regulator with XRE-family HTH domain
MGVRGRKTKEPTLVEKFAAAVKQRRTALGKSQQKLADDAGLSVSYVSMLERGQRTPPLDTVETVAKALDCAPTFLLG